MNNFDQLKKQYLNLTASLASLKQSRNALVSETRNSMFSQYDTAITVLGILSDVLEKTGTVNNQRLSETYDLCNKYVTCLNEVNNYKNLLLKTDPKNSSEVHKAVDRLTADQQTFYDQKKEYTQKYNVPFSTPSDIVSAASSCLSETASQAEREIAGLKKQAKEIVDKDAPVSLKINDPVNQLDNLPDDFVVAQYPLMNVKQQILKEIGVRSVYETVSINMRRQGNTIISVPYEHLHDREIDEFIIAYIMRFINLFPLGTVNVHIFDKNINNLYRRLFNAFQADNAGEATKKTIQINPSSGLTKFRDVNCTDITKKLKAGEDLYDLYENDHSDPFNLIVLREGIVSGDGFTKAEDLELLCSLTKPSETGHICGLRFLIVDSSQSFELSNRKAQIAHLLDELRKNCELNIHYDSGKFVINDHISKVLGVADDLDHYVQERSEMLADLINKQEKNIVTIKDVASAEYGNSAGSILYIPVGKTGTEIVELPISCRNDDQTLAGQCTGYMVIGLSGSGKSSFFHSLVINGCIKYSPKDLQFWLLDFKDGGASSKYSNSGLPHIKLIARDNKIDDALCLFRMAREEQERRHKLFNDNGVDNIIDYNMIATERNLEYLPRIIIAIDEVQEIFRDDNSSVIRDLISSNSSRMRSSGMHFVMIAQNLGQGKAYMLKESFMSNVTGRVCFHVGAGIPKDSGFEEEFVERKNEIEELKTGEAYISYGKGTIRKVKIAYITTSEMNTTLFAEIRNHYRSFADQKPLVIGQKDRLTINSSWQGRNDTGYFDVIRQTKHMNDTYFSCVGEESYQMKPIQFRFSSNDNSSLLFVGSDKQIASSLCASVALSLLRQNVKMHLFNGDKSKVSTENGSVPHPFMYVCQNISANNLNAQNHKLGDLPDVLKDIYSEFTERRSILQNTDELEKPFDPVFLIINDLYSIESYVDDTQIRIERSQKPSTDRFEHRIDSSAFDTLNFGSSSGGTPIQKNVQGVMTELLESGYKYNIFVILSVKDVGQNLRSQRILGSVNNLIIFNTVNDLSSFSINSPISYLREMMAHIQNEPEETMAVSIIKQNISKIRPIIYKLENQKELEAVQKLLKGA